MGKKSMIAVMKRVALALVATLTLAVGAPSLAQDTELAPEHLALARKYVELTDKSGVYEVALIETALETMQTLMREDAKIAEPADSAITKTLEHYRGRKGELFDQFARVYALTFSMEELQQIVAFYESPVGQKLSTANATINQTIQQVMGIFQANLKVEFFARVRAELRAAGHNL